MKPTGGLIDDAYHRKEAIARGCMVGECPMQRAAVRTESEIESDTDSENDSGGSSESQEAVQMGITLMIVMMTDFLTCHGRYNRYTVSCMKSVTL